MGEERMRKTLGGIALASIGPLTSDTARKLGLHVSIEANPSTIAGLVQAVQEYFSPQGQSERD
jgi:uroporphyrinogen III methyltransferase/synthase